MWLSGFPRATLSRPNNLPPAGSGGTELQCWAGGLGASEGGQLNGVRSHPWKHLSLDHHVQSPPGGLFVGECLLYAERLTAWQLWDLSKHFSWLSSDSLQWDGHIGHSFDQYSDYVFWHIVAVRWKTLYLNAFNINASFLGAKKNNLVLEWPPCILECIQWVLKGVIRQRVVETWQLPNLKGQGHAIHIMDSKSGARIRPWLPLV